MHNILLFGSFGWGEIVIIALVILLLFGGKKIPELMKGLGKGVKSFKEGVSEVEKEVEKPIDEKPEEVLPSQDKKEPEE
ncbi:MAG: twin-arginine translocase TatA/TatE family subunit [Bacteroidales bacterium]|nr:twin-arginine translocase TatA/TatE family subunit [Bacteroidales bacterium]